MYLCCGICGKSTDVSGLGDSRCPLGGLAVVVGSSSAAVREGADEDCEDGVSGRLEATGIDILILQHAPRPAQICFYVLRTAYILIVNRRSSETGWISSALTECSAARDGPI